MRTVSGAAIVLGSPGDLGSVETIYIQSADPVDMQEKVAAALALHPNSSWSLIHVDLAGGGDGHTFVCTLGFAGSLIVSGGVSPENTKMFFYLASDADSLAVARSTVTPQIAALFSAPTSASAVDIQQTMLAGAAKGTRFMGCALCTFTRIG